VAPAPCSALFERATHLQLPPKKMKFLFKRYLDYEKAHGTPATVEHVKKRAMEYVEAQAAA
jgi:rRNA biogenesis protein RRP5